MKNFDKPSILVIDDENIIREGAERILLKEGWETSTADNGEKGLELAKTGNFQILLLDLMMPGISGMDVLKTAREFLPKLLVIVITGYATIENAVEAMKHGAYDFIPKPFTPDQLRIVVRRAIDKLNLEHEAECLRLEREKSLQDIANEKSRTLTIINHMADGVLVTDRQGCIVLHNPAVTRMLGSDESSPLGKNVLEWTGNESLADMQEKVLKMDETQGISLEIAWGAPPGSFFMAHSAPVRSEAGNVLGSVTIFNDVTMFKELDQMKSDFVNMVSHELRSPLSSIRQQISVIVEGLAGETSDKQDQILSRVQQRIDGHIAMVSNLLDLSRIEAGRLVQQKERLSLAEIIEDAVELMSPEAEKKGLKIEVTIDSELFPLHADRQSMETVLNNLINNAIKYNREEGRIFISACNRGDFIELKVSDTGVGIAQENLPQIFDKFYRIRSEYTRKVIGSGLGLPLVKAIVEAHLGTITAESRSGEETIFTVMLPRGIN
jgi:two-component system, OmpR family, phosphate regulon sensor histidine kinase PhoR